WMNLIVTDKCTLKCKDCIMFAPYFKNPKHQTVKSLKKEVDLAFNVWKHIKSYQIVGGEPLIFPYLEEIIEYIGENYRKQIGEFLITTNGTVLPEESFFKKCAKYDMTIRISDYSVSKKFFKKQKVAEWKENLERFNIKHELFGTGIWHDFGNPNAKMIHSKEELINLYQNCDCVHSTIRDGKWYTCCRQAAAVWSGQVEEKEDFFDLKSNTENKQAILEFYLKFCKKGWLSCCEACFGDGTIMMNREVDAAEQLE
ncbi:MAG: radical SAM protein, partial [Anaerovoracaceae bacterium]